MQGWNIASYLRKQAEESPRQCAIKNPGTGEAYDFKELEARTDQLAFDLRGKGVKQGVRVVVLVRPGVGLIGLIFALMKLGAVPVAIDPGMGLKGFLKCVKQAKPGVIIGERVGIVLSYVFWGFLGSNLEIIINRGLKLG